MDNHVRQEALRRLGPTGDRVSKLDPILVNIGTFVVMVAVAFTTAPA